MTIDEAIIQFKEDAEYNRADLDLSWAEENEQVAKWLEELKDLREYKGKVEWVIKTHKQIKTDAIDECIDKFAEIMSNMHQICGRSCPVDCNWGTTTNCKVECKKWLRKQLKEQE